VLIFFSYAYFYEGADPNQHSRLFLTESIVHRASLEITSVHGYTIDKAEFRGRFFSDKAPGLSALAVAPLAVIDAARAVSGVPKDDPRVRRVRLHLVTIATIGVAGLLTALLLRRLLMRHRIPARPRALVVFAFAMGTLAFPFSTVLFSHMLGALLVLFAYMRVGDLIRSENLSAPTRVRRRWLVQLGLALGALPIVEYPSQLLVAILGLLLAVRLVRLSGWKPALGEVAWTCAAGAIPLLGHGLYSYLIFGSPLDVPYKHVFEPFFRMHHEEGLVGVNLPSLAALFGMTISRYRGLFFLCPILLLAFFGLGSWYRAAEKRGAASRADFIAVNVMLVVYFLFSASYYAWDGGGSTGPRHYLPVLPLVMIPIAYFASLGRRHYAIACALTGVSALIMLACTAVLIHQPEGEVLSANPFYEIVLPSLLRGRIALNTNDFMQLTPRSDASYNLGTLAGLSPFASLAAFAGVWIAAFLIPKSIRAARGGATS
jgi:hypothetical protein